jgi:hypothetical protein
VDLPQLYNFFIHVVQYRIAFEYFILASWANAFFTLL